MNSQPYHIKMILKLDPDQRSKQERSMLYDFDNSLGQYRPGAEFGQPKKSGKSKSSWGVGTSLSEQGGDWNTYVRCYENHPALKLTLVDGTDRLVYGGSCGTPVVNDADIYVGLDWQMFDHPQRFPWIDGEAIHYTITDGSIPNDLDEFTDLVYWLSDQIVDGKKVHIGCIGGHGRTGMVLAALVANLTNEDDAIGYVRTHYCKKAVESKAQVDLLVEEWGCKKVAGSKQGLYSVPHKQSENKLYASGTDAYPKLKAVEPVIAKHKLWPDYEIDE